MQKAMSTDISDDWLEALVRGVRKHGVIPNRSRSLEEQGAFSLRSRVGLPGL